MQPRITSPALSVPGVLDALQALSNAANEAASQADLPQTTLQLASLRASQINGCAVCLDMHKVSRCQEGRRKRGAIVHAGSLAGSALFQRRGARGPGTD